MTLVRWKPMDMVNLQTEMNRVFDDLWRGRPVLAGAWYPAIDLIETPEEFKLVAELPGMRKNDIKISFSDNVVTLRGEKRAQVEEKKKEEWHVVERTYGSFERSFHLNAPVQPDKVKAVFDSGVLTVVLPKSEESKAREIRIEESGS